MKIYQQITEILQAEWQASERNPLSIAKNTMESLPAFRVLFSGESLKTAQIRSNRLTHKFLQPQKATLFEQWIPDNVKNAIGLPFFFINQKPVFEAVEEKLAEYKQKYGQFPVFALWQGRGLVAFEHTAARTEAALDACEALMAAFSQEKTAGQLETMELKPKQAPKLPGSLVDNKIAVVTGGAQGFGRGIVEDFFANGADVVVADLNEPKGKALASELNKKAGENRALFVKTDVSDDYSVENLVYETVKNFGGIDIFISNAGVLRAGGLEEMDAQTFEFMTKVNYNAYFLCAKYASAVMKAQTAHRPAMFCDILQINSKSGLKGSNKNFAYAGSKFGSLGLTQSFAMELMPHRIKVNSICPGNFFDGPLWADPENGLFVQYLNAGKVPGAQSIAEVKRHYEKQVPAGRGCTVPDVMKAVYYAIDQQYETGQAIPVTGGQIMLS